MKFYYLFLLTGFVTRVFMSCSKGANQSSFPVIGDSVLIRTIDFDTTKNAGEDTMLIYQYSYDNDGRLSKTDVILFSNGIRSKNFQANHFYNGNDSLPYMEVELVSNINSLPVYTYVRFCNYSNGKLVYDSLTINGQPSISRQFIYSDNKIKVTSLSYPNPTPSPITKVRNIYLETHNGNVLQQIDTTDGVVNKFTFSYDNKKNPYKKKIHSPFIERSGPYYVQATYIEDMVSEQNNAIVVDQNSTYNFHCDYLYVYNSNGYPSIAKAFINNYQLFKRFFFYTKL